MGSLEDLFEREEIAFHSYDDIVNYLSNDGKRNKNSYRNTAIILAEPLAIREELENTGEVENLKTLKKQIDGLDISNAKRELTRDVDRKISSVSKELATLTEQRREQRFEEEKTEKERARKEAIREQLESAETISDVQKIKNKIENLSDEEASDLIPELEMKEGEVRQQRIDIQREKYEANLQSDDRRKRENARRWLRENT